MTFARLGLYATQINRQYYDGALFGANHRTMRLGPKLAGCDKYRGADVIFEIEDGKAIAQGTYDGLFERSNSFQKMVLAHENGI